MNKKGFTFAELLIVMTFVGILSLIVIPNLSGLLKQVNDNKYNSFLSDVYLATEAYVQKNIDKYSMLQDTGGIAYVYMSDLVTSKYLKSTLINPNYCDSDGNCESKKISICDENGKNCVIDDYTIVVTKGEEGIYSYELFNEILSGEYKETILNGAYPEISGNLVAVTIEDDGTVKRANLNNRWYSYQRKEWANAVILKDSTIAYNSGDIIPEENIESYFVWIPRYKYKIWNLGNYKESITGEPETSVAQTIEIVFESKDVSVSNGTSVGEYLTHPAFITFDTNGLWVGKFETGYDGATTKSEAQVSSSNSSKIIIKPNVYSWRNNTVSNIFTSAYNYNRSLDSHMMKNTEWGAVAYLHHSKYGSSTELMINNNSDYLTGYASVTSPTCGYTGDNRECNKYGTTSDVTLAYNTETGYKASTTGNISGIYDMAGGAHEYMASYIEGNLGSSGLTQNTIDTNSKYFDIYNSASDTKTYNYRILGDATGEMGPFGVNKVLTDYTYNQSSWYADASYFVYSSNPWFSRGATHTYGTQAGAFYFNRHTGASVGYIGFRLVLVG